LLLDDYCGSYLYENGTSASVHPLTKILTPEGYVDMSTSGYPYCYYKQDHLGSNREVTSYAGTTGTVVQQTEYYPSGTAYVEGTGAGIQPFKFTGKELIIMHGLNWQDYGARWLDNVRMQWTTMDPLCEKYYAISPYTYCSDDPAKNIDPDGRDYYRNDDTGSVFWQEGNANSATRDGDQYRNIGTTYSTYNDGVRVNYNQNEISSTQDANPQFNLEGGQYIPKTITTDDGTKVSVTFNYNSPTGGNGDKAISKDAVGLLITGINEANNNGAHITTVDVSTTTTGVHSTPSSDHYVANGATAIDIDAVNSVAVKNPASSSNVKAIQNGVKADPNLHENYGPVIQQKDGKNHPVKGHDNHIHIDTN
jgi:RHS repeat-associated protein